MRIISKIIAGIILTLGLIGCGRDSEKEVIYVEKKDRPVVEAEFIYEYYPSLQHRYRVELTEFNIGDSVPFIEKGQLCDGEIKVLTGKKVEVVPRTESLASQLECSGMYGLYNYVITSYAIFMTSDKVNN